MEIGKLDQKKKMAVEIEDYESAAALKKEIEQMRAIAYSNIPDYPEVSPRYCKIFCILFFMHNFNCY